MVLTARKKVAYVFLKYVNLFLVFWFLFAKIVVGLQLF